MTRERIDIVDPLHLPGGGPDAAHPLPERNSDARRPALERTEHQLAGDVSIEARPVEVGDRLPDQRRDICHIGDAVALARDERRGGVARLGP